MSSLNARQRARDLDGLLTSKSVVDLVVIGGGITGAGAALDAASRGLSVVLLERHDLAFGTSRWSSKLVHGGLRYLGTGDVGVAHESAVERDRLMRHIAPHLVRAAPTFFAFGPTMTRRGAALLRAGLIAGDTLRRAARTPGSVLPASRRLTAQDVLRLAPGVQAQGLTGGLLHWDGHLHDDARLVVGVARTAARYGARILTRCDVLEADGSGVRFRDGLSGDTHELQARAVINATGVWAQNLNPDVRIRPSRGSHLVVSAERMGGLGGTLTVPVAGSTSRFVFAVPAPHGRVHIGLTDVEAPRIDDVPKAEPEEIDFLLSTINSVLADPLTVSDIKGTYSGLRPLVDQGAGSTADVSRRHLVAVGSDGLVTVTGGKLTTYRAMAEDAVDAALPQANLRAAPCRTARLPLIGAGTVAPSGAPDWFARTHGSESAAVMAEAQGDPELVQPLTRGLDVCGAELLFAVRHEGALDVEDLIDRRTRVGVVAADRERLLPIAQWALEAAL